MTPIRLAMSGLVLCLALSGCGGASEEDDDDVDGTPPAALVGTWIYRSVTVDGTQANLGEVLDWVPRAVEARLQVLESSAFVYEEVNAQGGQLWAESGFVFVEEDEVEVNIEFNTDGPVSETSTLSFSIMNDVLTLSEMDDGSTIVFRLDALDQANDTLR